MDRQSRAYREMPINEHAQDIELGAWAVAEFGPAQSLIGIKLPNQYDEERWDEGRERPKTLEEARGVLLDRVVNPEAPDGDEVMFAYDEEG